MKEFTSLWNQSKDIIFLIGCVVLLYCLLILNIYLRQWYTVYSAKPYTSGTFEESNEKKLFTWMIHAYVPDHNAGSEWMAHALNTYWIREQKGRVVVISNKSSVGMYERVVILEKDKHQDAIDSSLARSQLLLTHHTMEPNAVQTSLLLKKPLVVFLHDHGRYKQVREYKRWLGKNLYIVTNSQWLDKFYSPLGISSCICYPPVSWRDYVVESSREYVTLINVNRNKGGEVLIKIAKDMPDVQFLGVKGAYNQQIVNDTLPNIHYISSTPNIKEVYGKTNILLMPSKEESWGRTAIEAMSSGIPVIAHPTPGLLESCGDAGIFCDREDIGAWVREIRRLLTDEQYYSACSLACKRRSIQLEPEEQMKKTCEWLDTLSWKEPSSK